MVRSFMKHNRRNIVNNTDTQEAGTRLLKKIYRTMDRFKADECVINLLETDRVAEIDLFNHGKLVEWAYTITVSSEEN